MASIQENLVKLRIFRKLKNSRGPMLLSAPAAPDPAEAPKEPKVPAEPSPAKPAGAPLATSEEITELKGWDETDGWIVQIL